MPSLAVANSASSEVSVLLNNGMGEFASAVNYGGGYHFTSVANEHDPFIASDGSYLVFTSDRTGGNGRGDLYVTFLQPDGTWGEPMNFGQSVNTAAYEYCAMLSPDGKYLFFTRTVRGNGGIYWVNASIIEDLRNQK